MVVRGPTSWSLPAVPGPVAGELARVTVKNDIVSVWEYAGFGDVLKPASNIMKRMIQPLHQKLKFIETLPKLFDISNRSLLFTSRVHKDDRHFLLNHWDKQISLFKILKDPSTWNSLDLSNLQFPSLPPSL